jgi:hypothetical protein
MKRFIYTLVPLLFCMNLVAQKDFFVFLQQGSGQPFYVRMGEKTFSSSSSGHLILAGLADSVYDLYMGFPKSTAPELLFVVPVHQKDRGFELKSMIGGWELFDLQSFEFIKALVVKEKATAAQGDKKTDTYSALMAGVVDDSSVLYTNVAQKEQPEKQAVAQKAPVAVKKSLAEVKKDSVVIRDTNAVAAKNPVTDTTGTVKPVVNKNIVRYGSENTEEGREIIYIDRTAPATDTIKILIPRL